MRQTPYFKKTLTRSNFLNTKNIFSDSKPQEIGEPQVSILSVINKTTTCLPLEINGSLYVNDYLICYSSKNMTTIERKFQQDIKMNHRKWILNLK